MPKRAARMWKRRSCQRGDSSIWSHQFEAFLSSYAATITAVGALITPPLRPITTVDWWSHFFLSKEQRKKERKKERRWKNITELILLFVLFQFQIVVRMRFFFCFYVFVFYGENKSKKRKAELGGREGGRGEGYVNCNCDVCGNRGRLSSSYLALALLLKYWHLLRSYISTLPTLHTSITTIFFW